MDRIARSLPRWVREPWTRFWFDYRIAPETLRVFRVAFFTLFAVDAWLQIEHAPRYGAGSFNVSHLPWLDGILPMPSRVGMLVVYLLQAYLALRIALGVTVAWSLRLLTPLFTYGYFISQLDSYQHHYLLFLVLVIALAMPWQAGASEPAADGNGRVPAWAARLLLCQLSLLYLWAAVAKLDPLWLDGRTLARQIHPGAVRSFIEGGLATWLGGLLGGAATGAQAGWAAAARLVLIAEITLAFAIHVRRLRPAAWAAGVLMHIVLGNAGLEIGLFSWFVVALYLVVAPDAWVVGLSRWMRIEVWLIGVGVAVALLPGAGWIAAGGLGALAIAVFVRRAETWLRARRAPGSAAPAVHPVAGWIALAVAVAASGAIATRIPLSAMLGFAGAAGALALALAPRRDGTHRLVHAGVHVACVAILWVFHVATTQAVLHHRYWGGDARRRGDLATAVEAYRRVTEIDPNYAGGHTRLADLHARTGRDEDALAGYRRAVALDPDDPQGYLGQARVHARSRRAPAAVAAADNALAAIARRRTHGALSARSARALDHAEREAKELGGGVGLK
jgi:hypothetical protein